MNLKIKGETKAEEPVELFLVDDFDRISLKGRKGSIEKFIVSILKSSGKLDRHPAVEGLGFPLDSSGQILLAWE